MERFESIDLLCDVLSTYIFVKDRHGHYIYANDTMAFAAGLDSKEQIIGKTDSDLIWRAQSELYRQGDCLTLSGKPLINAPEVQLQITGMKSVTTSKRKIVNPATRRDVIIGSYIEHTGMVISRSEGVIDRKTKRIHLGNSFGNETITFKEARIYFYLLLGMSATQTAEEICISKPTVNFHIENLKRKMQCSSKGELIATAILSGLTHTIFGEFESEVTLYSRLR